MNNLTEKRQFDQGLNADDSYDKLLPGEYFNGFNFRGFTSEDGHINGLEPIHSTTNIFSNLPAGTNYCIGGCEDEARQRIVWANWNSNGNHGIYAYDTTNFTGYIVLLSSQVTGGLNFDRFHYIHSCFVLNGCWYWTDNFNVPRRVNIDAGIALNQKSTSPISPVVINSTSIVTGGVLQSRYTLLSNFIYIFGKNMGMIMVRGGTGGSHSPDEGIEIPLDWSTYPITPYYTVLINGLTAYFTTLDPSGTFWNVSLVSTSPGDSVIQINISETWDWGLGDPSFPPTTLLKMVLYNYVFVPYTAPLSQSVISWIRRQPALPPAQAKVFQTVPAVANNFIRSEAFQFCWRYVYRDFETSTLSPLSRTANYNTDGNISSAQGTALIDYNRIDLTLPVNEVIDQDILMVDLVSVNLNSGVYSVIKTWDSRNGPDVNEIVSHNNGIPLSFKFYNDRNGIVLDSAYSVKPFDSVPILAQTAERAKNRSFLGGYSIGYDTPYITTLAVTANQSSVGSQVTGEWFFLKWHEHNDGNGSGNPPVDRDVSAFIMLITNLEDFTKKGYYIPTIYAPSFANGFTFGGHPPPFEATWDYSLLTFLGGSIDGVMKSNEFTGVIGLPAWVNTQLQYTDQNASSVITAVPGGNTGTAPSKAFKSGSFYQVAITYYDNAGPKCGVITNESLIINIPDITYGSTASVGKIDWSLSSINPSVEIPKFAYYYSIDITKCLRTRFFMQARGKNATYVTRDDDGNYVFNTAVYFFGAVGCAFDITLLQASNMGYTFSEGDLIKVYISGVATPYILRITGVSGNWVITQAKDIGNLDNTTKFLFEIYTPYKQSATEPYYEVAQIFPVTNPGLDTRTFSVLNGSIEGDISVLLRNEEGLFSFYYTEAMSPNDKFYKIWNTDAGRPNFIDKIGATTKTGSISWSNPFIQGSQINGLSTFDALDTLDLSADFGALAKLILTSKIQKEGSVMLAICRSETVSLYLGETQIAAPQGNAFLSTSLGVVGTIYPLKGSFGTGDPASVQQWRGNIFYFDRYSMVVVQYSDNGLEPVSQYKTRTFWRKFSERLSSISQAQIEAYGSRPFVIGGIDPFNGEYLLSIPQVEATNPNGLLPGGIAGAPQNFFDIYDGISKTMVYKIELNKWKPAVNYCSEGLINIGNKLFGLKAGALYRHNDPDAGYGTFYGVSFPCLIMFAGNILPNSPKLLNAINVEADLPPGDCYILSKYPHEQISDIDAEDWTNLEGVFYANVKRDRLSPAFEDSLDPALALNFGERMLSKTPLIQLSFSPSQSFNLKYANLGYQVSSGHKTIASK